MDIARQAVPLVLDLVRRLTEEYQGLPAASVVRCVEAASCGMRYAGTDLDAAFAMVEQLARADLDALVEQTVASPVVPA